MAVLYSNSTALYACSVICQDDAREGLLLDFQGKSENIFSKDNLAAFILERLHKLSEPRVQNVGDSCGGEVLFVHFFKLPLLFFNF